MDCAIITKLEGGDTLTDEDIATMSSSTPRTVRRHRSNIVAFGTGNTQPNDRGRPKTITPNMLTALYDELHLNLCMRLKDMVAFIRSKFNQIVRRHSVSRALKSVEYTKKVTRQVTIERNANLRADHIHERSFLSSEHIVYVDEAACDTSVGTRSKGRSKKGTTPVQIKRLRRGPTDSTSLCPGWDSLL